MVNLAEYSTSLLLKPFALLVAAFTPSQPPAATPPLLALPPSSTQPTPPTPPAPTLPPAPFPATVLPLERPALDELARLAPEELPWLVRHDSICLHYLKLLGDIAWAEFPEKPEGQRPGVRPAPRAPYVAAFVVKLDRDIRYMSRLRRFLCEHPLLVWLLGFPLVASSAYPWGFDVEASLPCARQFGRVLRKLPQEQAQFLLSDSVQLLQEALPEAAGFGEEISLDTKHIIAWVKENNPKAYIKARYDKEKQPKADPDCRLGCKRKKNSSPQETPTQEGIPASQKEVGEYYWGYASGVVATKVPDYGEFVLAETTQTFDSPDVSYFFPLMKQAQERLGKRPRSGALDRAFDAFYVYDYFHEAGGFAAVPLVARGGHELRQFDERGLPLCAAGLAMPCRSTFMNNTSLVPHERGRYVCPLLYPEKSGEGCPIAHEKFAQGGCLTTMPTSIGARVRYQLDRESETYKEVYRQRTATERVNAQAVEMGIERPKLRRYEAIANHNTLLYALMNLRGVQRVRERREILEQEAAQDKRIESEVGNSPSIN